MKKGLFIKIYTLGIGPVIKSPLHIFFRQIKVFRKLPKLSTTTLKGGSEIIFGEKVFSRPAICSVFVAIHKLKRTVHLVQRTCGSVAQLVAAYAPE